VLFVSITAWYQPAMAQVNGQKQIIKSVDTIAIENSTGKIGTFKNGEYKITIPQNDLNVVVDSFQIIPAMGLGTWVDFAPSGDGVMVMGDLVLTETDLRP